MPFPLIPIALSAIAGIGGALANRRSSQSSMPRLNRRDEQFADMLRGRITGRLDSPVPLAGFESQGITNINDTFDPIAQALSNRLTSRGLGRSPVAGAAETALELSRGGEIASFRNQLPLLQRELETQDLGLAESFLRARTGQRNETSTNKAGGAFTSAGSTLAFLAGLGLLGGGGGSGGGAGMNINI